MATLILYGGGATGPKKIMGHIESKIKNFEGHIEIIFPTFLPVRLPYFRYKGIHCKQTIYLAIAGSTYYSI